MCDGPRCDACLVCGSPRARPDVAESCVRGTDQRGGRPTDVVNELSNDVDFEEPTKVTDYTQFRVFRAAKRLYSDPLRQSRFGLVTTHMFGETFVPKTSKM